MTVRCHSLSLSPSAAGCFTVRCGCADNTIRFNECMILFLVEKLCVCGECVCFEARALHRKNVCHFSTLYDRNICLFWWSYVAPMAVGRNDRIVSSFRYNAPKPMECCCSLQKLPHKHITFHNNKAHIVFLLHIFFLAMRTNVC